MQHPQPLVDHFQLQGDCRGRQVGGNLSPNKSRLTWTDCNHSQTDWQRFENYCPLLYKHRQTDNMLESISVCTNEGNSSMTRVFAVGGSTQQSANEF